MQSDPQPGRYYVTAIDEPKRYFLAGPWKAYGTARQSLDGKAIKSALGSDPTAWQLRTG